MAKIELTVKQIMNLGLWDKVCEYKGWNTWILNEGQIDENDLVEFDDAFKKEVEWHHLNYNHGDSVSYRVDVQEEIVEIKVVTGGEEVNTILHFNEVAEIQNKISELKLR